MVLQKVKYCIFISSLLFISAHCNRNLLVQYPKFEFKKLDIKLNTNKDSLSLYYELDIPPESFGKRAFVILTPMFILNKDSIKFHTNTLTGEKDMDCAAISYKYGASCSFYDTIVLPKELPSSGVLKIFIYGNYKGAKPLTTFFEKELDLK